MFTLIFLLAVAAVVLCLTPLKPVGIFLGLSSAALTFATIWVYASAITVGV